MNREYRIIGIAMGRLKANECGIILTEEDKKSIKEYQEIAKKSKEEGSNIIFYAPPDMD